MYVVNFFGAPGSGKTTVAAGLFHELKKRWVRVEQANEYAKELVLNGSGHQLAQQLVIFANQEMRQNRLREHYELAISDAPLLHSAFYAPPQYPASFRRLVFDLFNQYDNLNFLIRRSHAYQPEGRIQPDAGAADVLSERLEYFLRETGVPFRIIVASDANPRRLAAWLQQRGLMTTAVPDDGPPEVPEAWMTEVPAHHDQERLDRALRDVWVPERLRQA